MSLDTFRAVHRHQHNIGRGPFERLHPLTCGNDSNHRVLEPYPMDDGEVGLYCPECDYRQPMPPHVVRRIVEANHE